MSYYADPSFQGPPCPEALEALAKSARGEADAIRFYTMLLEKTADEFPREIITKIRRDEEKHLHNFQAVYCMLTGEFYRISGPGPVPPATYQQGLLKAFQDEQEAYEFYKTNYNCSDDPDLKFAFWDAMMDEAEHARWFNNLLIRSLMEESLSPQD